MLQAPDILLTLFVDHITGRPRLDEACEDTNISFNMCRNAPPPSCAAHASRMQGA